MKFDKNQHEFPSPFHREIWWWAVGIVPPEDSLTDEVKKNCGPEALEGCYQWHTYFNALCGDMYENADAYTPASGRQYRDILEKIAAEGIVNGDDVIWGGAEWDAYKAKINKSKAYVTSGVTLDECLSALARTGLVCEITEKNAVFFHSKYPKIFHAMQVFERSPEVRQTPARHHFAHCEFRQLFKSYSANYDELMRRASDESLFIAQAIHDYCRSLKMQRYIHFGIMKYKYKSVRILDYNLYGSEYPTLRLNMGPWRINPFRGDLDEIFKRIAEKKAEIDNT